MISNACGKLRCEGGKSLSRSTSFFEGLLGQVSYLISMREASCSMEIRYFWKSSEGVTGSVA